MTEMKIDELIDFYIKYIEWYYKPINYKYKVGDLVKIPYDYESNIGRRGQLGIVQSYSGVENHIYVMTYDSRAKRYGVCGFEEDKLTPPSVKDLHNYKELVRKFVNWTYTNNIKLSTRQFKDTLERYKNGENVF